MMTFHLGAWLASCLHLSSPGQDDISQSLKSAQEQNSAANARNLAESKKAISQPIPMAEPMNAKGGIEGLLCEIRKNRKRRRDKAF